TIRRPNPITAPCGRTCPPNGKLQPVPILEIESTHLVLSLLVAVIHHVPSWQEYGVTTRCFDPQLGLEEPVLGRCVHPGDSVVGERDLHNRSLTEREEFDTQRDVKVQDRKSTSELQSRF